MAVKSHRQTSGFITLETIAITVVIALVLVVTAAIILYPQFQVDTTPQQAPVTQRSNSDIVNQRLDAKAIGQDSPFAPITPAAGEEEKPTNVRLYESQKQSFASSSNTRFETRFIGEIVSISNENGLEIRLISKLDNSSGSNVRYYYDPSQVSKITLAPDLKPGMTINIDETIDYSLPYNDGLQSVNISLAE